MTGFFKCGKGSLSRGRRERREANSMIRLIPLISLFLIFSGTVFGDQILEQKLSKSQETILGFSMWETRTADIFSELGETGLQERLDPNHDPYRYCYVFDDKTSVLLSLDLGWDTSFKKLTGFSMEGISGEIDTPGCKRLNRDPYSVKTDSGVYVGMDRASFLKLFPVFQAGEETSSYDGQFTYYELEKCDPIHGTGKFQQAGIYWDYWIAADFEEDMLKRYSLRVGGESDRKTVDACENNL